MAFFLKPQHLRPYIHCTSNILSNVITNSVLGIYKVGIILLLGQRVDMKYSNFQHPFSIVFYYRAIQVHIFLLLLFFYCINVFYRHLLLLCLPKRGFQVLYVLVPLVYKIIAFLEDSISGK